jgi:hypothetical protein
MTILGIDPGKSGAVAVLDEGGELLKVHDTPSTLQPNAGRDRRRPREVSKWNCRQCSARHMRDRAEAAAEVVDASPARSAAPALDLASEILEGLALNRKAHGLAHASVAASTLIGADAAAREVASMREALEATIRFSGIENEGTRK